MQEIYIKIIIAKKHQIILPLFLIFIFIGCNISKQNANKVLELSGKNRPELEKVIQHYKNLNEKEKLKAVFFLIGNMKNKYGRYGETVKSYYPVFDKLRTLHDLKICDDTINKLIKNEWDSLEKTIGPITVDNMPYFFDYNFVSANYLIENIDMAFKAWKEKPWARDFNFHQFCEYILPYRIYDEPIQPYRKQLFKKFAWLEDSLKDKTDPLEACIVLNRFLSKDFIFCNELNRCPILGINEMLKYRAGICEHRYFYIATIMRSVGIPVAIDFTPQWNRWPGGHAWMVVIDKNGKARPFNGGEPSISFPDSVLVPIGKGRITKIFRNTFALQKNSPVFQLPVDCIPPFLRNLGIMDVTDEYDIQQENIKEELRINPNKTSPYAFLCCFGYSDNFVPIAFSKCKSNTVEFNNIGKEAIYITSYYIDNELLPAINPVFYPFKGNPELLTPSKTRFINVKLTRKYGCGGNMDEYTRWMIGARFQASNEKYFKNPVTLYTVDSSYYSFVEKDIKIVKPYRYYRYVSSDTGKIRIAEIEFNSPEIKRIADENKSFSIYGFCNNYAKENPIYKNAFDGIISSNFNAPPGSWVAIDYGKPVKVNKIRFLVRNDLNIVEVGDEYELFYFDFGWQSLGKKVAEKNYVIFTHVPDNALLLLRDLTKGHEERIFMYQNGQQVWY